MQIAPDEIAKYLHLLAETPRRVRAASGGLAEAALHAKPDAAGWSANDVLAHLRACVDVWGKEIWRMLAEETPTWQHLSPRTWMRKTDYPQQPFHESFEVFCEQRQAQLHLLQNLSPEQWARAAMVKQRAHVQRVTVFDRVRQMALHEQGHCAQIEELFKGENQNGKT